MGGGAQGGAGGSEQPQQLQRTGSGQASTDRSKQQQQPPHRRQYLCLHGLAHDQVCMKCMQLHLAGPGTRADLHSTSLRSPGVRPSSTCTRQPQHPPAAGAAPSAKRRRVLGTAKELPIEHAHAADSKHVSQPHTAGRNETPSSAAGAAAGYTTVHVLPCPAPAAVVTGPESIQQPDIIGSTSSATPAAAATTSTLLLAACTSLLDHRASVSTATTQKGAGEEPHVHETSAPWIPVPAANTSAQCAFCDKTFATPSCLLAHCERRHPEKRPSNVDLATPRVREHGRESPALATTGAEGVGKGVDESANESASELVDKDDQDNARHEAARPQQVEATAPQGIMFHKKDQQWQARVRMGKKIHHVGYFDRKEDATKARAAWFSANTTLTAEPPDHMGPANNSSAKDTAVELGKAANPGVALTGTLVGATATAEVVTVGMDAAPTPPLENTSSCTVEPTTVHDPAWIKATDPRTQQAYYWHNATREVRWACPTIRAIDKGADPGASASSSSPGSSAKNHTTPGGSTPTPTAALSRTAATQAPAPAPPHFPGMRDGRSMLHILPCPAPAAVVTGPESMQQPGTTGSTSSATPAAAAPTSTILLAACSSLLDRRSSVSTVHDPAWIKATDPKTQRAYYWHNATREVRWTCPTIRAIDKGADPGASASSSSSGSSAKSRTTPSGSAHNGGGSAKPPPQHSPTLNACQKMLHHTHMRNLTTKEREGVYIQLANKLFETQEEVVAEDMVRQLQKATAPWKPPVVVPSAAALLTKSLQKSWISSAVESRIEWWRQNGVEVVKAGHGNPACLRRTASDSSAAAKNKSVSVLKPGVLTQQYQVEAILKKKRQGLMDLYWVKWVGWGEQHNTWEPKEHLEACTAMMSAVDAAHATKRRAAGNRAPVLQGGPSTTAGRASIGTSQKHQQTPHKSVQSKRSQRQRKLPKRFQEDIAALPAETQCKKKQRNDKRATGSKVLSKTQRKASSAKKGTASTGGSCASAVGLGSGDQAKAARANCPGTIHGETMLPVPGETTAQQTAPAQLHAEFPDMLDGRTMLPVLSTSSGTLAKEARSSTGESDSRNVDADADDDILIYEADENETLKEIGAQLGVSAQTLLELNAPRIIGLKTMSTKFVRGTAIRLPDDFDPAWVSDNSAQSLQPVKGVGVGTAYDTMLYESCGGLGSEHDHWNSGEGPGQALPTAYDAATHWQRQVPSVLDDTTGTGTLPYDEHAAEYSYLCTEPGCNTKCASLKGMDQHRRDIHTPTIAAATSSSDATAHNAASSDTRVIGADGTHPLPAAASQPAVTPALIERAPPGTMGTGASANERHEGHALPPRQPVSLSNYVSMCPSSSEDEGDADDIVEPGNSTGPKPPGVALLAKPVGTGDQPSGRGPVAPPLPEAAQHRAQGQGGYVCLMCQKVFPWVEQLRYHEVKAHPHALPSPGPHVYPTSAPLHGIRRPMYYHFPALDGAYTMNASHNAQYFFGPDMIVAPVTAPAGGKAPSQPVSATSGADGKPLTVFRCPFTGKRSADGGGSKPCTKVCSWKADLKKHYRTHFDVRPYKCRADAACRKSFKDTSTRCKHERTHTTQSFDCPVCKRAFTRQDNMQTHLKRIHGDLYASAFTEGGGPSALHEAFLGQRFEASRAGASSIKPSVDADVLNGGLGAGQQGGAPPQFASTASWSVRPPAVDIDDDGGLPTFAKHMSGKMGKAAATPPQNTVLPPHHADAPSFRGVRRDAGPRAQGLGKRRKPQALGTSARGHGVFCGESDTPPAYETYTAAVRLAGLSARLNF